MPNPPKGDGAAEGLSQFLRFRCCVDETGEQGGVGRARADDVERDAMSRMRDFAAQSTQLSTKQPLVNLSVLVLTIVIVAHYRDAR